MRAEDYLFGWNYSWLESFVARVLKVGEIPNHVAFIMDGNRTYAKLRGLPIPDGHYKGGETLYKLINWCFDIGVTELSVFAFSTENFQRSAEEVEGLLELFSEQLGFFLEEKSLKYFAEHGIKITVLGDNSPFPEHLQRKNASLELLTAQYKTLKKLNIAVGYSGRDDITGAIQAMADGVKQNLITIDDIDKQLLQNCLQTTDSKPVDLLLRSSGQTRLSHFMLWQAQHACIQFVPTLWPDFGIWNFFVMIVCYQRYCKDTKNWPKPIIEEDITDERLLAFLSQTHKKRMAEKVKLTGDISKYETITSS